MARIGSTVVWMGKVWENQFFGIQPVWGVKKSPTDDEKSIGVMTEKKKSFAEYLEEALKKKEKC